MINRFNFYDLYGYVVPGLAFVTALWLPYVVIPTGVKTPDLTLALGLVVLAYVVGHFVQVVAARALPSTFVDAAGKFRHPSDIILDENAAPDVPPLPKHMRDRLIAKVKAWFGPNAADPGEQAFFLCRSALLQRGKGGYSEQMQGMYTLMRGLTIALLFASAYYFGWCLAGHPDAQFIGVVVAAVIAVMGGFLIYNGRPVLDISVAVAHLLVPAFILAGTGYVLGDRLGAARVASAPFGYIAVLILLLVFATFRSFRKFAVEFAMTVYRDFLVLERKQEPDKAKEEDKSEE